MGGVRGIESVSESQREKKMEISINRSQEEGGEREDVSMIPS